VGGCLVSPARNLSESGERERTWHTAIAHAEEGTPPLRFPVYETLYLLNAYALVDLLEEVNIRLGIGHESLEYHQGEEIDCLYGWRAGAIPEHSVARHVTRVHPFCELQRFGDFTFERLSHNVEDDVKHRRSLRPREVMSKAEQGP
jgi:hypothetical protein